ncbi:hypothetical protein IJI94_00315 [Candidatus Saccharibacteria bacterium]|nr:hypothetical protein [Candidatus Saccharibacteria bacterium]
MESTEDKEQAINKKYKKISLIILIVGLLLGGSLITIGIIKRNSEPRDGLFGIFGKVIDNLDDEMNSSMGSTAVNGKNNDEKKAELERAKSEKAEKEKEFADETDKLTTKRDELLALDPKTANGFSYEYAMSADDGDAYTLRAISNLLEYPNMCWVYNIDATEKYCSLYQEIYEYNITIERLESEMTLFNGNMVINTESAKEVASMGNIITGKFGDATTYIRSRLYIYPGIFIIFVSVILSAFFWFGARKKALGKENHPQGPQPEIQEVTEQKDSKNHTKK